MESRKGTADEHQVTLDVSFVQAVEKPIKEPPYQECYRDGQRKRLYESLSPEHYFHFEYQLFPGHKGAEGQRFKTDLVCFGGVVSKIYTEKDSRVVQCWEEGEEEEEGEGLNHFGWRHKHTFKVNKSHLLDLYDHTMEIRVWNTRNKLSARARYDRPKAFRLPANQNDASPKRTRLSEEEGEGHGESPEKIMRRPSKLPVVLRDQVRVSKKRSKQVSTLNVQQSNLTVQQSDSVMSVGSMVRGAPVLEAAIAEDEGDRPSDNNNQLVPHVPSNVTEISSAPSRVLSRRALKKKEAELAEQARVDREGIAILRLKMSDLFAKDGSVKTKLTSEETNKDIKSLEVGVSLATPLMPERLLRELNPMTITITRVSGLPDTPLSHQELRERCQPAYLKYKFHSQPGHASPGHPQSSAVHFNHTHVILAGTIDPALLTEYLRGPPLVVEVHDRDVRVNNKIGPSLFGAESRDDILGTHAFGAGLSHSSSNALTGIKQPWNSYGVARLDLSGLLHGQRVIQITAPVTSGPRNPATPTVGGAQIPPGDYVGSQCELTAVVELTYSLLTPSPSSHITPQATPTKRPTSKATPLERRITKVSPKTPKKVKQVSSCPFNRVVYIISVEGKPLVNKLLTRVNELNAKALGLNGLPPKILRAALSTYKLTRDQMVSGECDIVTGYHVEDWEKHIIVLEGLRHGALREIWTNMPHHTSQASGLLKVFFNSEFAFSKRLYATLDVDLPRIKLYQPLSELTQQSLLYIRDMIPRKCFRALMCLSELTMVSEMADITRNNLLLTAEEVAALSLQFAHPLTTPPMDDDDSTSSGQEMTPERPLTPDLLQHQPRQRVWEPLEMTNPLYERLVRERGQKPPQNFIKKNILHSEALSNQSASRRSVKRPHHRSLSESSAHNYSSQALNSTELAHSEMRRRLDPNHRYTYCHDYHSMTVVPLDIEAESRAKRLEARSKWRTLDGFIFPGVKTSEESNVTDKKPHPTRVDDLTEPFEDNLLHANTLKPTVERDKLSYSVDFERWRRPPKWLGPVPPITIHLAGESRHTEVKEFTDRDEQSWREKVVVDDTSFHTHRKAIRTELELSGPRAATQLDKLQGVLKSSPQKFTLKHDDYKLDDIPALSVVHNPSVDPRVNILVNPCPYDDDAIKGGYYPGPDPHRSLKRDCGVIPRAGVHRGEQREGANIHTQEFRLHYHTHQVLSKQPILPLQANGDSIQISPTHSPQEQTT